MVKHIEKEIEDNKKSPEVVAKQLKEYGFEISITGKTIRNAIKNGIIFESVICHNKFPPFDDKQIAWKILYRITKLTAH